MITAVPVLSYKHGQRRPGNMNTYVVRMNFSDAFKVEIKCAATTRWEALQRVAHRVPYGMGELLYMVAREHTRTLSAYRECGWVTIDVQSYRPEAWWRNLWHASRQTTIRDMDGAEIADLMRVCLDMQPLASCRVCLDGVVWEVVG